ncbi:unnamed protein product [Malus baccata var. baccata]
MFLGRLKLSLRRLDLLMLRSSRLSGDMPSMKSTLLQMLWHTLGFLLLHPTFGTIVYLRVLDLLSILIVLVMVVLEFGFDQYDFDFYFIL